MDSLKSTSNLFTGVTPPSFAGPTAGGVGRDISVRAGAETSSSGSNSGLNTTTTDVGSTALRWTERLAVAGAVDAGLNKLAQKTGKKLPAFNDKLPMPIQKLGEACEKNAVGWDEILNIKQCSLPSKIGFKTVAERFKHNFGELSKPSKAVQQHGLLGSIQRAVLFENLQGLFTAIARGQPGAMVSSAVALSFLGLGIVDDAQKTLASLQANKAPNPNTGQPDEAGTLEKTAAGSKAVVKGLACWEAGTIGMVAGSAAANVFGLQGWQSKLAGIAVGSLSAVIARSGLNQAENQIAGMLSKNSEKPL